MSFEMTFMSDEAETALGAIQDRSPGALAAGDAIRAILASGALGQQQLVHAHATTSERMVAVLVRVVEHPEDAR